MIWLQVVQALFGVGVLLLVIERTRSLAFVGALDAAAFRRGIATLVRRGERGEAHSLVQAALPAWSARAVAPWLDPDVPDDERRLESSERLMDVEDLATRGMRALRIAASIASALGFIGAAVEIWWVFTGDHGLRALQAGLVENEGLGRAVLSIALGISTSSLALGTWSVLKKVARDRVLEARRVVATVEELVDSV